MYNRYIPQPDGSYRRRRVPTSEDRQTKPREAPPCREQKEPPGQPETHSRPRTERHCPAMSAGSFLGQLLPKDLDTGDLIVILLLLLMAGDCREDRNTAMLTLALYLFM